mgnify:CR=1 FL=1
MNSIDIDVIRTALDWQGRGHRVVMGTVVRTWGSAPRPPGSLMVIRDDGQVAGSVSGGCIEDDLVARIRDGRGREGVDDARSGAEITTFRIAPVLTIVVGSSAAASRIWYVAPDGAVQLVGRGPGRAVHAALAPPAPDLLGHERQHRGEQAQLHRELGIEEFGLGIIGGF